MSTCPNCGREVNRGTANKRKHHGVIIHKLCPEQISYRKKSKSSNK